MMGASLQLRAGLVGVLLLAASSAQANDFWSSLWRTPDQRGQQLLEQGDAKTAARTFADPQRKAYAELQAGDYAAAARDFAAFDSSDAQYNRGNALAHAGDLQAALKAYDAALARDPNNRDARHNRDLVAQALKQAKPPAEPKPNPNDKQNPDKNSDKGSGKEANKGSNNGSSKSPGKDAGKNSGKSSDQDTGKNAGGSGQPPGDKQGKQSGQQQQAGKPGLADAGKGTTQPNPAKGSDADQARRDAEASLGKQAHQPAQGQPGTGSGDLAGQAIRPDRTEARQSEQQLAQEQWLRQIPDDPGGLLRRKFLIEHLMRQQGNQR